MDLFRQYLKGKKYIVIIAVVYTVVFYVFFALYRIPAAAVIYPSCVCLFFSIVFLLYGYAKVKGKYERLDILNRLSGEMIEKLPRRDSPEEERYIQLVNRLRQEVVSTKAEDEAKYRDMIDYYTVWAHQIKTPIASIKLAAGGEDSELARRVSSELTRIEQYVNMVLVFLRLDSDYTDYVFKKYDMDRILKESIKKFASDFIQKKIKLEYTPVNETVLTDEKWFSFVIEQLLSNALKYTNEGSVKIYSDGPYRICIEDTGIGIDSKDLPRIFEKGYTGFNGRKDKSSTGLGLYLCKKICDRLGVGIKVTSELYRGTRVFLDYAKENTTFE